jgi:hypothetical protein
VTWWIVLALGGLFVLLPGMVNPFVVINGATLVGLVLISLATYKLTGKVDR